MYISENNIRNDLIIYFNINHFEQFCCLLAYNFNVCHYFVVIVVRQSDIIQKQ